MFNCFNAFTAFINTGISDPNILTRLQATHLTHSPCTLCLNRGVIFGSSRIIGKNDFPYHSKKIIVLYKKIDYNIDVLRQTACLVVLSKSR